MFDDGLADRAWLADPRLEVHQQAGTGIDLDDGAPLLCERLRDVFANEVDAGDVETDDARRQCGDFGGFGMDVIGDVEFMIGVALDQDVAPGFGHGVGRQVLA